MIMKRFTHVFATASLALTLAAAPVAFHAASGLQGMTAAAKEVESGGKHAERGDDKGGNRGGKKGGDDHPGAHSQNGKQK